MTLTTTITFADLITAVKDELDDLEAQYDDTKALIEAEWDADPFDMELPDLSDVDDEDTMQLVGLAMNAMQLEESAKESQKRLHVLKQLREEYDDGRFELRMLTGQEVMDIETQLKMKAQREGVDRGAVNHERHAKVADTCVVDAPEGFPTDDDGDPKPSDGPQALMFALYNQCERLNSSGATDFTAPGFGDATASTATGASAPPSTSPDSPVPSAPTDANTDASGTD
jgi:hypothetical protein